MKLFHQTKSKITNVLKLLQNSVQKSQEQEKPTAVAFVDYEHWYYSYLNNFNMKPNIVAWQKELQERFYLEDIKFFANFSGKSIRQELSKIRTVTNSIIETEQMTKFSKDMTDFIMLDFIYQYVNEHPQTDVFILFTGDAHFQSVVKYLIQKHNKKVIVYGVKKAFSMQLRQTASEAIEIPASDEILKSIYPYIVEDLAYCSGKINIYPTFSSTAAKISSYRNISEDLVKAALNDMKNKGYIYTRKERVDFNQFVNVLAANWEALEKVGLWSFE